MHILGMSEGRAILRLWTFARLIAWLRTNLLSYTYARCTVDQPCGVLVLGLCHTNLELLMYSGNYQRRNMVLLKTITQYRTNMCREIDLYYLLFHFFNFLSSTDN